MGGSVGERLGTKTNIEAQETNRHFLVKYFVIIGIPRQIGKIKREKKNLQIKTLYRMLSECAVVLIAYKIDLYFQSIGPLGRCFL